MSVSANDIANTLSVPSPLAGEGQGEGWPRALNAVVALYISASPFSLDVAHASHSTTSFRASGVPLSPTLPREGGGSHTAVASTLINTNKNRGMQP
ncbi:hypothetical protein ACVW17_001521 [Bradyrhizobium sp. USDA 4473]